MTEKLRPVGSEKIQDPAQRLARIQELAGIKKPTISEATLNTPLSTVLHDVDAADGTNYGLVQEGSKVYIKKLVEGNYEYLTGLENKTEYQCESLAEGLKKLNLMLKDINALTGNVEGIDILKKK
jgi:hypothetical protein